MLSPSERARLKELVEKARGACPTLESWENFGAAMTPTFIHALIADLESAERQLADCYRATGADPDGNEDWRLAEHALTEVKRLRRDCDKADDACDILATERDALREAARWIPVETRMPERDQCILLYKGKGNFSMELIRYLGEPFVFDWTVTHWQFPSRQPVRPAKKSSSKFWTKEQTR